MSGFPSSIPLPPDPVGNGRLAANIRTVLRAIRALATIRGTDGITTAVSPAGVTIGLRRDDSRLFARVSAVIVNGDRYETWGQQPPYAPPSQVRYDVVAFGRPDIGEPDGSGGGVVRNLLPVYGRPIEGDESSIWPSRVGDRCEIVRAPDQNGVRVAELHIWRERIAFHPCKRRA